MRYLAAFALLAACASDPSPPTDAGQDVGADLGIDTGPAVDTGVDAPRDTTPTIDDPPVTDTGPVVDAGHEDTGSDVVRVDGAPCIPACAAGSVCVGGVCEAVDGGGVDAADAGSDVGPRPAAEAMEFQSCEPRGSSCGGDAGVVCATPGRPVFDAGARGACLRPCRTEADCPAESLCLTTHCAVRCVVGGSTCARYGGECVQFNIGPACM